MLQEQYILMLASSGQLRDFQWVGSVSKPSTHYDFLWYQQWWKRATWLSKNQKLCSFGQFKYSWKHHQH